MDDPLARHRLDRTLNAQSQAFDAELEWLAQAIDLRLKRWFAEGTAASPLPGDELPPPTLPPASPYAEWVSQQQLDPADRLIAALCLAPHLRPALLDVLSTRNEVTQRPYTEFGGVISAAGFAPTVQTACFLLAGDAIGARLALQSRLRGLGWLQVGAAEVSVAASIALSPDALAAALDLEAGVAEQATFPARRITTGLSWSDLVLPAATIDALDEIRLWIEHGPTLLDDWGLRARMRAGYTALFHGPPGTGKTLSAALLGQRCAREVRRIDLSLVVSKYIGETERNLGRVFDAAERHGWILFFDEADALFGKRTRVSDAHDRYANQEVSYLLQRVEEYAGVAILASNLRHNIDEAFTRRFDAVIGFAIPSAAERARLWREAFPAGVTIDPALDLARLAQRHELTGGTIINVVRHACLRAAARGETRIAADDVEEGVRREGLKEGKAW